MWVVRMSSLNLSQSEENGVITTHMELKNENWENMDRVSVFLDSRKKNNFTFRFRREDDILTQEQRDVICFFVAEAYKRKLKVGKVDSVEFCCFNLAVYRLNRWIYIFNYEPKECSEGHKTTPSSVLSSPQQV